MCCFITDTTSECATVLWLFIFALTLPSSGNNIIMVLNPSFVPLGQLKMNSRSSASLIEFHHEKLSHNLLLLLQFQPSHSLPSERHEIYKQKANVFISVMKLNNRSSYPFTDARFSFVLAANSNDFVIIVEVT
jgi:hypothetical protein